MKFFPPSSSFFSSDRGIEFLDKTFRKFYFPICCVCLINRHLIDVLEHVHITSKLMRLCMDGVCFDVLLRFSIKKYKLFGASLRTVSSEPASD